MHPKKQLVLLSKNSRLNSINVIIGDSLSAVVNSGIAFNIIKKFLAGLVGLY